MKIVFEGTLQDFNDASEYGILLRKVNRQPLLNGIGLAVCGAAVVVSQMLAASYQPEEIITIEIYLLAALIAVLIMDRSGSLTRRRLQFFFRRQLGQTEKERSRILSLVLEKDGKLHAYCDNVEQSVWDCNELSGVLESEEIFDLKGGKGKKTTLSIPKSAIKEGSLPAFRAFLVKKLPNNKTICYRRIPDRLKKCLAEEKARVRVRK